MAKKSLKVKQQREQNVSRETFSVVPVIPVCCSSDRYWSGFPDSGRSRSSSPQPMPDIQQYIAA